MSEQKINPHVHQYCTTCYEVVELGHRKAEHSDESGQIDLSVDVYPIHKDGADYIAQDREMGHFSPHHWIEVDGQQMCGECGAIKIND